MFDPSQPPLISETLLKKRRSLDELSLRRSTTLQTQNKRKRVVRGENVTIKRPEQFVKEFRIKEGSRNIMKRLQKDTEKRTRIHIPKSELKRTIGFIVRIHIGRHASDEIKSVLSKMKLFRKYDAIFTKLDEETIAKLRPYESYLAYGYVTFKSVSELLHRRAFIYTDGLRTPLTDNRTVEDALGDRGFLCINDLCHEIFTVGPSYQQALNILCPFKLSSPVGTFERKLLDIHDEVEEKGGFIGEEMDSFLSKIL